MEETKETVCKGNYDTGEPQNAFWSTGGTERRIIDTFLQYSVVVMLVVTCNKIKLQNNSKRNSEIGCDTVKL